MIVAVAGGKGGVGKTTVAHNLGAALGAVVVDADVGMADLPGDGPDCHDVLAGRVEPTAAVREGPTGTKLLPGGRTLAGARAAETHRLPAVVGTLAGTYDHVVVDCPGGLSSAVGQSLLAADGCVLVTTVDEAAVVDAVRTRALARRLDAGLVRVVYNRARSVPGDSRSAFGAPAVAVPESEHVAAARARGQPVRSGEAATSFEKLAAAVQSCNSS